MLKIGIIAAEPSGDLVGADLMRAIKSLCPSVVFEGIAGPKMLIEGCVPIATIEQLSVMGFVEVLAKLPTILAIRKKIKRHFLKNLPDVFIGVDAPDFNLNIELFLRKCGVKTVHYNSPTLWAWRKNRIKLIQKSTSLMLTLFPFEASIYEEHKVPVQYLGHPLADNLPEKVDMIGLRKKLGIESDSQVIALLPGSRASEIKHLGEIFLKTAQWCLTKNPQLKFIIPMINQERLLQLKENCADLLKKLPIQLVVGKSHEALAAVDAALIASGTATLEAALLRKPMVVAYRLGKLNYYISKMLVRVSYFSLPNLVSNKLIVPEYFQAQATPEQLGSALLGQLERTNDLVLQADFKYLRQMLAKSANKNAAEAILRLIGKRS